MYDLGDMPAGLQIHDVAVCMFQTRDLPEVDEAFAGILLIVAHQYRAVNGGVPADDNGITRTGGRHGDYKDQHPYRHGRQRAIQTGL